MQPETILSFFSRYIESEIGVVFAQHNAFQLQNRLEEISKLMGVPTVEKLYEQAQKGIHGPFKQLLLDVATNNETSFFRDGKVFRAIESIVFKPAREATDLKPIRIWSAASSTGQEALSISISITEENLKSGKQLPYSILGTDISERALTKARQATYSQLEVQRGMPAPLLIKYFKKTADDNWTANHSISSSIEYKKLNLKEPFRFAASFDLVLCRNVLIYQTVPQKIEVLDKIIEALAPGGYLVLGSGESLIGISDAFTTLNSDGAILYRKKGASL